MKYKVLNNDFVYMEIKGGMIYAKFKQEQVNREVARKIIDLRLSFVDGQTLPALIDGSTVKHLTKEAREVLSSERASQYIIALAVIVRNPVTRAIANFFLKFQQPPYPFKLFTDPEKAKQWLRKYQSEEYNL